MIVKIMKSGRSFTATGRYHLHDAPRADADGRRVNPTTSARVRFTAARNLVNDDDPRLAMLEMWHTAASQTHLKAAAGLRGGATATPVKTIVLSWPVPKTGEAPPDADTMIAAADDYLAHMGWDRHQALFVGHDDKPHPHLHIILNRVHPETGALLHEANERRRSQPWALAYEREDHRILCRKRLATDYSETTPAAPAVSYAQARLEAESGEDLALSDADLARLDEPDRDLLPDWQRRERAAFHAGARAEGAAIAARTREDVRETFKPQWRSHYRDAARRLKAAQAAGPDAFITETAAIAAERRALGRRMNATLRDTTRTARAALKAERRDRYLALKIRQSEERAEARHLDRLARRGEPVDEARRYYLAHGPVNPPTEPSRLLTRLRQANDDKPAIALPIKPAANSDRPPQPIDAAGQPGRRALRASIHAAPLATAPWPLLSPTAPQSQPLEQRLVAQLALLRQIAPVPNAPPAPVSAPAVSDIAAPLVRTATERSDRKGLAQFARALRQRLRGEHLAARAAFASTTNRLMSEAEQQAEAEIGARFGHLWAMLLAAPRTSDFAARVAALKAQQASELATRKAWLVGLVRDERAVSGNLLADLQRRQQRDLRARITASRALLEPSRARSLTADLDSSRRSLKLAFAIAARLAAWRLALLRPTTAARPHAL